MTPNEYTRLLERDQLVQDLIQKEWITLDKENQVIKVIPSTIDDLRIKDIDLNSYEDGPVIMSYCGNKYIFYLVNFGSPAKIRQTTRTLYEIIRAPIEGEGVELHSLDNCSAIYVIPKKGKKIKSTSVYSNHFFSNIKWILRPFFKVEIKKL